jgi:hypothetical protein
MAHEVGANEDYARAKVAAAGIAPLEKSFHADRRGCEIGASSQTAAVMAKLDALSTRQKFWSWTIRRT